MSTNRNDDSPPGEFLARLEALRRATGKTREEIYAMIGISRAMVHLVRTGKRSVSQKTMDRLEEAELASGIRRTGPAETKILDRILNKPPRSRLKLTKAEIDSGFVEVLLKFRRGEPPKGACTQVKLKALDSKTAAGVMVELLLEEDFDTFIGHCLPRDVKAPELFNQITPECYTRLAEAALALTFGLSWEKQLPRFAKEFRSKPESG